MQLYGTDAVHLGLQLLLTLFKLCFPKSSAQFHAKDVVPIVLHCNRHDGLCPYRPVVRALAPEARAVTLRTRASNRVRQKEHGVCPSASIAETDWRRPLQAMFEVLTLIAVAWLATRELRFTGVPPA